MTDAGTSRCRRSHARSPGPGGTAGASSACGQPRRAGLEALGARDFGRGANASPLVRRLRCAIYTRKSTEEGLEQEFNSLDAQREACAAYIASQRVEGWIALPTEYDDGGFSGGTLERPALQRLLADIEAGLVDVVVVYKIDRLSRSLTDFSKLVEVFDRNAVTFVSVTQAFNTTTSMGRLTLNILLSFAQFEREVIGERIRDKFAASRKRGMWMGGWTPLGYDVVERKLVANEAEASLVRRIFARFLDLGSVTLLVRELQAKGARTKLGKPFDKGILYKLLHNRIYVGEAVHKGVSHPGEHEAIVDRVTFERVQAVLATNGRQRAATSRRQTPALLKGLLFSESGRSMTPTHTRKGQRLYRYYVSTDEIRGRETIEGKAAIPLRLPAEVVESATVRETLRLIRSPEVVSQAVRAVRAQAPDVGEAEVISALDRFWDVWKALIPAEQARVVQLLVERVEVREAGLAITLHAAGLGQIAREMLGHEPARRAA
jgi:DNA invertase Pin-like site-specific DNA recombinase